MSEQDRRNNQRQLHQARASRLVQGTVAPTVAAMLAALLGIALGIAVTLGPLVAFDAQMASITDKMVTAFAEFFTQLLSKLPWVKDSPNVVATFATIIAVVAPGMVALLLVVAAHKTASFRRALSGLLLLAACASFFVLPATQAAVLVIVAVILGATLIALVGLAAQIGLWALATVITVDNALTIWWGKSLAVQHGATAFEKISGLHAGEFWRFTTLVLALAPFVAAVFSDPHGHRTTPKSA